MSAADDLFEKMSAENTRLQNELTLANARAAASGEVMLEVQQECVGWRKRAERAQDTITQLENARVQLEHAHCIEGDYMGDVPPLASVIERLTLAAVRLRDEKEQLLKDVDTLNQAHDDAMARNAELRSVIRDIRQQWVASGAGRS